MTTEIMKQIEDLVVDYVNHFGVLQAIQDFKTRKDQEDEDFHRFNGDLALGCLDRAKQCNYALDLLYGMVDESDLI
jgi:hypothetical protein